MSEEEQIILPERYKRVKYLEDTGIQWIDTEYIPNSNSGLYIMAEQITYNDGYPMGVGYDNTGITAPRKLIGNAYSVSYSKFITLGSKSSSLIYKASTNWLNNKKIITELGETVLPTLTFTPTTAINLFRSSSNRVWKGRIYEAKISEGTEIIKHFVPAFDTLRSEACMYEVIEGKAYYNEGSGDFLYNLGLEDEQLGILHKLPQGFKRVKYLIANGYQYIDTNYVPTNETGYYLEGQGYVSESTARYYFGSNETTDWNLNQRIYFGATPNNLLGWMTSLTVTNAAANLRQETKVALNFLNSRKCITTINDADIINELSDLSFTPSQKIFLFSLNLGGMPISNQGLKGRIDTFLISEEDQIVRQFVPCLDADGIPCMYELYTGTVHYNQGSGQFSYPREYTNDPINLPAGYIKCVYLQSNGTQWIDTEVIPNADTGVYIKTQHLNYGDYNPFGSWENSSAYFYPPRFNTSSKHCVYSFGTTYQSAFVYDKADDLVFTSTMNLYNDRTVNFWSDDTNWFGIIPVNFTVTFTRSLWLFSRNHDDTTINETSGKFAGRIFRAKITQGTSLIHDYVPCLDDSGRPCMYDLIDRVPLYNQSGGAEFAYCLEHQLPSDFVKLKYLESDGTQFIKTGYVPTNNTGLYIDAYNTVVRTDWTQPFALRETNGNTYVSVGRVNKATNGAGFGWNAYTAPGGTGDCRYEATLNWLNDKKSIISAPAFAQRVNTLADLAFTPTFDLCLFGIHYYDGTYNSVYYRIYRAKISEGTEIVRDWVPAYDTRRDKPCMYDLINNVAYYNDGIGEFLYNRDFEGTYTGFGIMGGIGNRLGSFEDFSNDEENENISVTLLESISLIHKGGSPNIPILGNDCIDSLISPLENYIIELDYRGDMFMYCEKSETMTSIISIQQLMLLGGITKENSAYIHSDVPNGNVIVRMKNDSSILLDENYDEATTDSIITNFSISPSGRNTKGLLLTPATKVQTDYETSLKIKYWKIYDENNNLISNMLPAQKEDGVQGLYCSIRNVFLPIETL